MLLAAGVKMKSERIIPIIIDTDEENGNTKTTLAALANYHVVYDTTSKLQTETELNGKKVKTTSIFSTMVDEPKIITISGTKFGDLKTIVAENGPGIDPELKRMLRTIYNSNDLDMPLTYGFIGHPNIGSVVLSYLFQKNEEFRDTVRKIGPEDKIFIISSIFGGTGAAGFPLLLNILNNSDADSGLNKAVNLKGAVSLLPYYQVGDKSNVIGNATLDAEDENGEKIYKIDSSQFNSKTFAAQLYYDNWIDGDIDAMYYVGDEVHKSTYPNNMGGEEQNNPAHVVEMKAALCIFHFDNESFDKKNKNDNAKNKARYAKEIFTHDHTLITPFSNKELRNSLVRMWMFYRFYNFYLPEYLENSTHPIFQNTGYHENNYKENSNDSFAYNIKAFLEQFKNWTKQLEDKVFHPRTFEYVDSSAPTPEDGEHIHFYFKDFSPKKEGFFTKTPVDSNFLGLLNDASKNQPDQTDVNTLLMRYVSQAIDDIINNKMI